MYFHVQTHERFKIKLLIRTKHNTLAVILVFVLVFSFFLVSVLFCVSVETSLHDVNILLFVKADRN